MNQSIVLGLVQNTAILLVFGMLYDYLWAKSGDTRKWWEKGLAGCLLGGFGIILILTPWTLVPGLFFDTRSVMLSVSGLFFGPVPTIIAMAITAAYRIFLGGDGLWMGVAVIVTSGGIGLLWRTFHHRWGKKPFWELLSLGVTVHLVMLGGTVFLPQAVALTTLKTIALPVMIIYPAGTLLLGLLMRGRLKNWDTRKALAQSEERWKFALEGAGDGVWDWNIRENIVYFSPRYISMLGYQAGELKPDVSEWEDRIHPDDKEWVLRDLRACLENKTPEYNTIHRLHCKDGSYKWILDRGKVMQWDEQGNPLRMIGTHTDMSQQKQIEEELSVAKEKAEESDRLKMSFLKNISHEIRTPMNAIVGFSQLLNEEISEAERKRFVQIINTNATQLLTIIDDVLEMSSLDSQKIQIESEPFSVYSLLEDLHFSFQPDAKAKKLDFSFHANGIFRERLVLGDQFRLRQILTSFLTNALKYTYTGSIELSAEEENDRLVFRVKDTGIGISPDARASIFHRFYRAPETIEMAISGTGLGLSIARELAECMNGTIGMVPREPAGSVFFLSIPLHLVEQKHAVAEPSSGRETKQLSLLIAEDELTNIDYLKVIFERKVKKIWWAKNGQEAVDLMKTANPDVILMDLKMPVMNGYEATRIIRESHPYIPVIALTAYSHPEEKREAAAAGCTHFLTKPIQKKHLFEILSRVMP